MYKRQEFGDPSDIARALSNLASVMKLQGDYERAFSLYSECLTRFREVGDGAGQAWTLNYLGDVAREKAEDVYKRQAMHRTAAGQMFGDRG